MTDQTKQRGKGVSRPRSTAAIGIGRGSRSPYRDQPEEIRRDALAPAPEVDFSPISPQGSPRPTSPVPSIESDEPDSHRRETILENGLVTDDDGDTPREQRALADALSLRLNAPTPFFTIPPPWI